MTNAIVILTCLVFLVAMRSACSSPSSKRNREPKCIAVDSYATYVCTDNPEASRRAAMAPPDGVAGGTDGAYSLSAIDMDLGVEQRITGSETEQLRIRNVLRRMRTYMEDEVLSRSEYEHVRDKW